MTQIVERRRQPPDRACLAYLLPCRHDISHTPQHGGDCHRGTQPLGSLLVRLLFSDWRPHGAYPTSLDHPVERRVERSLTHLKHILGDLLDALCDRISMHALGAGENPQNQ